MVPARLQGITVSPRQTGGRVRGRHLNAASGTQIPLRHKGLLLFNGENPEFLKIRNSGVIPAGSWGGFSHDVIGERVSEMLPRTPTRGSLVPQ